ncbi:type II toxin-antitoxin system HicB family antitoxin [Mesorhizobium sp. M2D.F.Ca.ET.185.01.1.1]|uniref:type II toxin-antitoxin system HicB family antitoxin n=1 Tax=unclassified Mesorhizobium TaxID=325217 RepID=UPI000FCC2BD8|nr:MULTISPECIES: type II toxin-antitoxin system HicB family antitoxin [unclassified Mesorhizobium]TGP80811.1 type II toxin-antitoxin system HicB family antitoxin [bacterium M00.F.Ca.ET.227.01.1.1]TGP90595.1 type II toxin-antitoxin system HicB family antitoxin [bacterium M00.F.Ca.ET.221.01.1.1]TGP97274.1 type II toxin-antitoxin system HicB family antitoxin [bacterium M00.F.Ca.ET.222.01.1.1]TGU02085.1 type II toxin-antitoxin system HicB family antitoxin [bacterium M00.F.Ca.ET.163.01.1.1]TGU26144
MLYAVIIEKAGDKFSAYVPDLPGCIPTGATTADVKIAIREAMRFHIEGLRADGFEVPEPEAVAKYVEAHE